MESETLKMSLTMRSTGWVAGGQPFPCIFKSAPAESDHVTAARSVASSVFCSSPRSPRKTAEGYFSAAAGATDAALGRRLHMCQLSPSLLRRLNCFFFFSLSFFLSPNFSSRDGPPPSLPSLPLPSPLLPSPSNILKCNYRSVSTAISRASC